MESEKGAVVGRGLLERYLQLGQPEDRVQVMYVWVDGSGEGLRAKTRTLQREPRRPTDLPLWNFDGSSTGQASTGNSDVYLQPVALFNDPFRLHTAIGVHNKLALCETFKSDGRPTDSNHRAACAETMRRVETEEPWFGMEQEFMLLGKAGWPYRWPEGGFPAPQGPYYCGVGYERAYGRPVLEAFYRAALFAGISVAGTNAEVAPAQWEFQVGPCEGVAIGDQLWMARFILNRVAEDFGLSVTLHPKPVAGANWNGAGLHTNFSTKTTRSPGGLAAIKGFVESRLAPRHADHLRIYDMGGQNAKRLTGRLETSSLDTFTWGVADRAASVRIPRDVARAGFGYLEDRRPPANADPYLVSNAIASALL